MPLIINSPSNNFYMHLVNCSSLRLRPGRAQRSYPTPEVRGRGREVQPHIQGAVACRAQAGREELLHVQGQEGRP